MVMKIFCFQGVTQQNQTLKMARQFKNPVDSLNMQFFCVCVAKWKNSRDGSISEDKHSLTGSPPEGCKATDNCTSSSCEICFLLVQHASVF